MKVFALDTASCSESQLFKGSLSADLLSARRRACSAICLTIPVGNPAQSFLLADSETKTYSAGTKYRCGRALPQQRPGRSLASAKGIPWGQLRVGRPPLWDPLRGAGVAIRNFVPCRAR